MDFSFMTILLGYLIGSISPAYLLGKLLKGIDIREHGDGNAGGMNIYYVLGLKPAIATGIFDISKGLISMYIASLLGASAIFVHLTGIAAVAGHVFPFYLKFKGGKGIGTCLGILFYNQKKRVTWSRCLASLIGYHSHKLPLKFNHHICRISHNIYFFHQFPY